jgi:hypothetical protein
MSREPRRTRRVWAIEVEVAGAESLDDAIIRSGTVERLRDVYVLLGELGVTIGRCPSLIAIDLLSLDSEDLRQRPLEERREAVSALIAVGDKIGFSEAIAAEGALPHMRSNEMPDQSLWRGVNE